MQQQQQRRVKTYGRRTTRIITVNENSKQSITVNSSKSSETTESNTVVVSNNDHRRPTKRLGSDDDDGGDYSEDDDTKHSSYLANGKNRGIGSMRETKKHNMTPAATTTKHQHSSLSSTKQVRLSGERVSNLDKKKKKEEDVSIHVDEEQNMAATASGRPSARRSIQPKNSNNTTNILNSTTKLQTKKTTKTVREEPYQANNSNRSQPQRSRQPVQKKRYIESSSSSDAIVENISSSSSVSESSSTSSISFGVPSLSEEEDSDESITRQRRRRRRQPVLNRKNVEIVDLSDQESSEDEQPRRAHPRADAKESYPSKSVPKDSKLPQQQRDTYVNTPQIKASHLWHARNRRVTPLKKVPRISLTSTESYSPVLSPVVAGRHLPRDDTSSPLTWDTTMTPMTQRLQDLSLGDDDSPAKTESLSKPSSPDALRGHAKALNALLKIAGQITPVEFSNFLDTFKQTDVQELSISARSGVQPGKTRTVKRLSLRYHKIAEASYSEVFGIGDLVLKIVPLAVELEKEENDEEEGSDEDDEDIPFKSSPDAVLKEIMITQITGNINTGFIKLLKLYIVTGKYPKPLLREWDEYKAEKGSESTRPDRFNERQLYAVVVLPNAGIDLETYKFDKSIKGSGPSKSSSTVWRDAAEIFWQVTSALAGAEEKLKFEHRDLHWGQIVIQKRINAENGEADLTATIIDLGLSRIETDGDVHFSLIEDEVFTGRGILSDGGRSEDDDELEADYQFDVYRMMRHHNTDEWRTFRPLSNVMWLHYLATKLLNHKGLKRPSPPARTTSVEGTNRASLPTNHRESEWIAYQYLKNVENRLELRLKDVFEGLLRGKVSPPGRPKAGPVRKQPVLNGRKTGENHRSTGSTIHLDSASDVVAMWLTKGW
ncbi:hypothetical protein FRC17_006404 [Serendipita sp. 399]|nr:hypothetical protein FRC17_006404 [Serendipita sp. 399]